jgi:hypothetical protein
MSEKLNKLRQFLRPTTEAEARASMQRYEASTPDEPGFVHALESEMREEYLARAHALQRAEAQRQPQNTPEFG